ncbi:hypothetical protein GQ44DRAFT_706504 [Phaeosphaeriaceae sp. PMI808]|nr:hypothetical protein GQ44DRAFT_706504 [Phaeosphaeriaceae sp. PMI808]
MRGKCLRAIARPLAKGFTNWPPHRMNVPPEPEGYHHDPCCPSLGSALTALSYWRVCGIAELYGWLLFLHPCIPASIRFHLV